MCVCVGVLCVCVCVEGEGVWRAWRRQNRYFIDVILTFGCVSIIHVHIHIHGLVSCIHGSPEENCLMYVHVLNQGQTLAFQNGWGCVYSVCHHGKIGND